MVRLSLYLSHLLLDCRLTLLDIMPPLELLTPRDCPEPPKLLVLPPFFLPARLARLSASSLLSLPIVIVFLREGRPKSPLMRESGLEDILFKLNTKYSSRLFRVKLTYIRLIRIRPQWWIKNGRNVPNELQWQ